MHRIDHPTRVALLPDPIAPGSPGYFTEGDPGTGTPATVVTRDWANAIQEEIAHVIEHAGGALDKEDRTQLRVAIDTRLGGYLPLGGGTLVGDLKFTDGLYDIGKSGATRPRHAYLTGNVTVNGTLVGAATLIGSGGHVAIYDGSVNYYGLNIQNTRAANALNNGRWQITCLDTGGVGDPALTVQAGLTTVTAGAENGKIQFSTMIGGSQGNWLEFQGAPTACVLAVSANGPLCGQTVALNVPFKGAGVQNGLGLRPTADSTNHIVFQNAADSNQGAITDNGAGVISYNSFVGAHDSQLQGGQRAEILPGTIMETVDEVCDFGFPEEHLLKCKVSDQPGSDRVYGVFFRWDEPETVDEVQTEKFVTERPVTDVVDGKLVTRIDRREEKRPILAVQPLHDAEGKPVMVEEKTGLLDEEENEIVRMVQAEAPAPVTLRRPGNVDLGVAGLGAFIVRMAADQTPRRGYVESAGNGCGRFQASSTPTISTVAEVLGNVVIKEYDDGSFVMPCRLMKG